MAGHTWSVPRVVLLLIDIAFLCYHEAVFLRLVTIFLIPLKTKIIFLVSMATNLHRPE
jgi:hypothetical protein